MVAAWARGSPDASIAEHRVQKDVCPTWLQVDEAASATVHYLYSLSENSLPHLTTLTAAARSITHLGWGLDMATGNAAVLSEAEAAALPGEHWRPANDLGRNGLRVPVAGTLNALIRKHGKFLNRIGRDSQGNELFNPVPPLTAFRVVEYRRATDPPQRPFIVFELRRDDDKRFSYPQEQLIHLAGMVRHLAIKLMGDSPPREVGDLTDWVRSYVAGHCDAGVETHRQLSYLPLPSIRQQHTVDPAVRRVMIAGPVGDGPIMRHLSILLDGQKLIPTPETRLDHPPTLVRAVRDNVTWFYTEPATNWASVTPVILPGHNDHKPDKTRKLIEKALQQSGVDIPCEFEWGPFSHFPKSLPAFKHDRDKRPTGYIRPDHLLSQTAVHLKVRFNDGVKVPGPLAIGAGRHCGFGLMAAIEPTTDR